MNYAKHFLFLCTLAVARLVSGNAVVAGTLKFEASRINDSLTARDGATVKWQFFTEGPIRYEPCLWKENVYVGSDDGYLYCLDAATGNLTWKFFAGSSNRKMIGNERLISVWHVSAGPVIHDGKVFFAAGTWPMLGVFVYALDAKSGKVVWLSDESDAQWQPSSYRRQNWKGGSEKIEDLEWEKGITGHLFGSMPYSVMPKGQCLVKDGHLIVPCGRSIPAYYDTNTGQLLRELTYKPQDRKVLVGSTSRVGKDGQERLDDRNETANWPYQVARTPTTKLSADPVSSDILQRTQVTNGYCLVLGIGDGRLIDGLVAGSDLRLIVFDPDAKKVDSLRRRLDAAGYYGSRVTAQVGDPMNAGLPPYFASLVVVADLETVGGAKEDFARKMFPSLRPYGGVACVDRKVLDEPALAAQVKQAALDKAEVQKSGDFVLLRRAGALTGAGAWSHQHADAGNTAATGEKLAKSPLGALWFGGAAGDTDFIYPIERAGRGVIPLIVGGRILYEQGKKRLISATDVYTGRLLWQWVPPDKEEWIIMPTQNLGKYEETYGINTLIGRMAGTEDAVYVVSGNNFYALKGTTGKPLEGFTFTEQEAWKSPRVWRDQVFLASPKRVLSLDRRTGKVLWSFNDFGGDLVVGGDKVFCQQDADPKASAAEAAAAAAARRRGKADSNKPTTAQLVALDAKQGTSLWKHEVHYVAKSRALAYSEPHDLLFTSDGALIGKTGKSANKGNSFHLDTSTYGAATLLLKDRIFTANNPKVLAGLTDLASGSPVIYTDPITGAVMSDVVERGKNHLIGGCGPAVAGEYLATLRMDSAAYYDFQTHGGVCNIIGVRPACTAGMIPADGVVCLLNTNICTCRYPVFTTMAMIHMPEAEMWTYFPSCDPKPITKPVKQIGINFGAPGDRLADNNTLWLEYPMVGGPSPRVQISYEPAEPRWFRYHQSRVKEGDGIPWVCASGAKDLKSVTLQVNSAGPYRVREYYAESIAENDLKLRSSVVEHRNVKASEDGKLTWTFTGKGYVCGLELIDEALASEKKPAK